MPPTMAQPSPAALPRQPQLRLAEALRKAWVTRKAEWAFKESDVHLPVLSADFRG